MLELMEKEKAPVKVMLLVLGAVLIIGGGWWYMSKRANCNAMITYVPAQLTEGSSGGFRPERPAHGEYYELNKRKYGTHGAAMSVCMGF